MAFSVASLVADQPSTIEEAQAASVSFPEFYSHVSRLSQPS
jgi:5-enolpyruvylshikimate-3-phosphate synthase